MHEYILPFSETSQVVKKKNPKRKYGVKMKQISKWEKKAKYVQKTIRDRTEAAAFCPTNLWVTSQQPQIQSLNVDLLLFSTQHSHSYTTEVIRKMCIVLLFSQKL